MDPLFLATHSREKRGLRDTITVFFFLYIFHLSFPGATADSEQTGGTVTNSVAIGSAVTSRDLRRSRRSRPRARQTSSPPPSTTVQTLMEMGFPRKAVEHAAKALGGIGDMTPSPESIVGWLLEHQALVC